MEQDLARFRRDPASEMMIWQVCNVRIPEAKRLVRLGVEIHLLEACIGEMDGC